MERFWKCPKGHSWDAYSGAEPSTVTRQLCPRCGAAPVSRGVLVADDTEVDRPESLALLGETLVRLPAAVPEGSASPSPPPISTGSRTQWDVQAHEDTLPPPRSLQEDETVVPSAPLSQTAPTSPAPAPSFDETLERPSGSALPPLAAAPDPSSQTLSRPAPAPGRGRSNGSLPTEREPRADDSADETLQRGVAPPRAPSRRASVTGYEILGVLGRGGMGVVYKARQTALGRTVALKMILAGGHAGAQDLDRFRLEAQAVAQLQHPNIVQVYEVGERDGLPFFSLEYLDGGSLQQKLDGTPQPPRLAAGTLETLAQAMNFAHQKGIIHRDLKPANVLLTADGTPKIADFGLAKRLEQDAGHTGSEAILGTPAYMAPEQAAGKARFVGPAADIYSLGAILYDLLTGRPPFRGTSVIETLQMVQSTEPIPPGQLQPTIPRDLQTICLKCLEKEPGRRYAGAGALAEDLRRFREGRPILARPTPAWERAWKWARRRPALAGLYTSLLLGSVALLVVILAYTNQLRIKNDELFENQKELKKNQAELLNINADLEQKQRDLKTANADLEKKTQEEAEARQSAVKSEKEAQDSFLQAQRAVEKITLLSQKRLRNQPHSEALRRELLGQALEMCQYFLTAKRDSEAVILRAARAYRMVADLSEQLGKYPEARTSYRAAADLFRQLIAAATPKDPRKAEEYRRELVEVLMNAWSVAEGKDPREAEKLLAELERLLAEPALDPSQGESFRWYRAAVLNNQGIAQKKTDLQGALKAFEEADRLLSGLPTKPLYQLERARVEANQGALWTALASEKPAQAAAAHQRARKAYEQALKLLEPLADAHPNDPAYARELGRTYANLGVLLKNSKQPYESLYAQAVTVFDRLAQRSPDVVDYRHLVATSHAGWGQHLLQDQHLSEALTHLRKARGLLEELVRDFADVALYREELARCCNGLGLALRTGKAPAEAREPLEKALSLLDELRRSEPDRAELANEHAAVLDNLIGFHESEARRLGLARSWSAAEDHVRRLLPLLETQAGPQPAAAERGKQADVLITLAQLCLAQGQYEKADAALLSLFEKAPPHWEKIPRAIRLLGRCMLVVEQDRKLTNARRRQLLRQYAQQTLDRLRDAAPQGGKELAALLAAPELELLRTRPEFKTQLDALHAPPGPRSNRP